MTRVLIVDDERLARARIRNYLQVAYPDFELQEACDAFEALEKLPQFQPEIVFLDIEMPELSGMEMLRQLPPPDFQVIFETAYDEFAVAAFEQNACDYLRKPFTDQRLKESIERALKRSSAENGLQRLESHWQRHGKYLEKLVVKVGTRSKIIEVAQVKYFVSEDHMTQVRLDLTDYAYDNSLSFLEERLDPEQFIRIHRNAIVRVSAIEGFTGKTAMELSLAGGVKLKVARNRTEAVLERLAKFANPS